MARAEGGRFLLRIEDIDTQRCRPTWEAQIYDDLTWLGITWDDTPLRQSAQMKLYQTTLDQLWDQLLLTPCRCTRADLTQAAAAPQEGVPLISAACQRTCMKQPAGSPYPPRATDCHLRLDMATATQVLEHHIGAGFDDHRGLMFQETGPGHRGQVFTPRQHYHHDIADVVLARRDIGTSYHLSVVLDDAAQDITHVVRGEDLFEATRVHVLLQHLMGLKTPVYHHHRLIRDETGKRLAKRDDARAIATFRTEGASPTDIRRLVGLGDRLA